MQSGLQLRSELRIASSVKSTLDEVWTERTNAQRSSRRKLISDALPFGCLWY
jgi:hypothetical protein